MAKHIFDKDGFHIGEFVKGVVIDEGDQVIEIEIPHGVFYQPRLVDGEVVEGLSQEEIDERMNTPSTPTQLEIMQEYALELDYKLVLMELGFM